MSRNDYDSDEEYAQAIHEELEVEDYYIEKNVFGYLKLRAGKH